MQSFSYNLQNLLCERAECELTVKNSKYGSRKWKRMFWSGLRKRAALHLII